MATFFDSPKISDDIYFSVQPSEASLQPHTLPDIDGYG